MSWVYRREQQLVGSIHCSRSICWSSNVCIFFWIPAIPAFWVSVCTGGLEIFRWIAQAGIDLADFWWRQRMSILMLSDGNNMSQRSKRQWRNALGGQLMRVMMDMAEMHLQSARFARQSACSILKKQHVCCPNKRIEKEHKRHRFSLFASQNAWVHQVASFTSSEGC